MLIEKVQEKHSDYSKHKIIKYVKTTLNEFNLKYNTSIDNLIKQDKFKTKAKLDLMSSSANSSIVNNENNNNNENTATEKAISNGKSNGKEAAVKSETSSTPPLASADVKTKNSSSAASYGSPTPPPPTASASSSSSSSSSGGKHSDKNAKKFKSSHNQPSTSPSLSTNKSESKVYKTRFKFGSFWI